MQKISQKNLQPSERIGMSINELPTPVLIVDLPVMMDNLSIMQKQVAKYGKFLRPHVKTHKSGTVGRLQMEAGAIGVSCATVGEAETMAAAGIRDILIANQIVTHDKLVRIARLLDQCDIKFTVDSLFGITIAEEVASRYGCSFEVLIEVDSGGNRCGAQSPQEAVKLLQAIQESPSLRFGGIQAYNGGASYIKELQERERAVAASDQILADVLGVIHQVCDVPRVSGAGTGNSSFHLQNGLLTEIQSGSYVYSDTTYRTLAPEYRPALFVLSTVISRPMESRVILDAGLKSMGTEFSGPELLRYPHLKQYHFSEEHLQWQVDQEPSPKIGEKVLVIPSHCCTTVNLHRHCYAVRDEKVADVWKIEG